MSEFTHVPDVRLRPDIGWNFGTVFFFFFFFFSLSVYFSAFRIQSFLCNSDASQPRNVAKRATLELSAFHRDIVSTRLSPDHHCLTHVISLTILFFFFFFFFF
ncbi:hypothetical protein F4779DRAFT_594454, partial [Xylariaceae sp. FL0662B]